MTTQPLVATIEDAFTQEPTLGADPIISPKSATSGVLVVQAFNPVASPNAWDTVNWTSGSTPDTFWAGPGGWQDIAPRTRGLSWSRGAESPLDRPRVGTAEVDLDNLDGEASPWATTGDFSTNVGTGAIGPSWLLPGVLVRFGAVFDGEWLPFFTGRIESLPEGSNDNTDAWVTLTLNEMTADLAAVDDPEQSPAGTSDTLDERLERLLTEANWISDYTIAADPIGDVATYQATTLAQNRLTEIYLTADSTGMRVLAGSDGRLYMTSAFPLPDVLDDHVHSNFPEGSELPLVKVTPYASTDRILNVAIAARVGSIELTEQDTYSVNKFGRFGNGSRDDLIVEDDDVVRAVLRAQVANSAWDVQGVESVDVDMDQDPINLPAIMAAYASTGLEVRQPFNLRWVHPSGAQLALQLVIEGMKHEITPTAPGTAMKWTATLSTATRIVSTISYWDDGSAPDTFWDVAVWSYGGV